MRGSVLLLLLSLCLVDCADAASPQTEFDGLPDAARVFAEVARVRQLAPQRAPRVLFLRRQAYLATSQRLNGADENSFADRAVQTGLDAGGEGKISVEAARLLASDGFYARSERTIYILDDPARRFPTLEEQVLAHESVHALQDLHGLLPPQEARFSDDEALARRALVEGDATMGMLLYQERNWRTPTQRLAERVMRGFADAPISRYVGATDPVLLGSPAYQQEMVMFPYRGGAAFVGAVLAAGDYALVQKAFAAPPVSTAQVLHPERYARGELPVAIPPPPLPEGYQPGVSYVWGELLTRSLLLRCNPEARAMQAAEGWRGDTVITLRKGAETLTAQQWLLDSERDAHELAAALRSNAQCPNAAPGAAQSLIAERGARVVMAHGAAAPQLKQLSDRWLGVTTPVVPNVRPLGDVDLPGTVPRTRPRAPFQASGWLRYPEAGVELPVPDGFTTSVEDEARLSLTSAHADTSIRLMLGEYFEGAPEQILLQLSREMQQAIAYSNIIPSGKPYRLATGVGAALAQDFEHEDTIFRGRVVALPLCNSAGLLAVVQNYGTGGAEGPMKEALTKLRTLADATYCAGLRTERVRGGRCVKCRRESVGYHSTAD